MPGADTLAATRTARALVLEAAGRLVEHEIPLPELRDGEAILLVEACGLCGSDHEYFTGDMPAALPLVPGHEVVGRIDSATPTFLAGRGLAVGDRVALEVFQSCGTCTACQQGNQPLCRTHGMADSYGNTPLGTGSGLWGGYASHLVLTADAVVHRVPAGLDPVTATLFNPLGAGVRWGVTIPGISEGDVVAVLGPGIRGLCAASAALAAGARYVLLTGAGAGDAARLEHGRALGVTRTVDVLAEDAKALLKADVGGLADVVVDVTAAAPSAFMQAIGLARPGGTVVIAGTRGTHRVTDFDPDKIVLKELRVLGARGVDSAAYASALDLLTRDGRLAALPRVAVPLDAEAVSALLVRMSSGADRPLHAVVVP